MVFCYVMCSESCLVEKMDVCFYFYFFLVFYCYGLKEMTSIIIGLKKVNSGYRYRACAYLSID